MDLRKVTHLRKACNTPASLEVWNCHGDNKSNSKTHYRLLIYPLNCTIYSISSTGREASILVHCDTCLDLLAAVFHKRTIFTRRAVFKASEDPFVCIQTCPHIKKNLQTSMRQYKKLFCQHLLIILCACWIGSQDQICSNNVAASFLQAFLACLPWSFFCFAASANHPSP